MYLVSELHSSIGPSLGQEGAEPVEHSTQGQGGGEEERRIEGAAEQKCVSGRMPGPWEGGGRNHGSQRLAAAPSFPEVCTAVLRFQTGNLQLTYRS